MIETRPGDLIKKHRLEKGLTQKQLGEKCGINEANIRKYELGTQNPKIQTLERIAKGLDIPLRELCYKIDFSWSSKMPESMGEHYKNLLVAAYDNLSDSGKSDAYKLLRAYSELNTTGQDEALKRTKELSKIEGYRKGDPNPDPDKPRFN